MDETYLRVRSAGSQGSFLTRQYLEEVLPQFSVPSAVNLFPCPGRVGRKASSPLFPERTPLPG